MTVGRMTFHQRLTEELSNSHHSTDCTVHVESYFQLNVSKIASMAEKQRIVFPCVNPADCYCYICGLLLQSIDEEMLLMKFGEHILIISKYT